MQCNLLQIVDFVLNFQMLQADFFLRYSVSKITFLQFLFRKLRVGRKNYFCSE